MVPHVIYHIAAMGNWKDVVREQVFALRRNGLAAALTEIGDAVGVTFVGAPCGQQFVVDEAGRQDVPVRFVRTDPNTDHYETFAMLEIERRAKVEATNRPILYFHTKGVSTPRDRMVALWRGAMQRYVLDAWPDNVAAVLGGFDAAGWNWVTSGEQHFSGNFWVASPNWIRKLPDYVAYHHAKRLERSSCETWLGAQASPLCRALSRGVSNAWRHQIDYAAHQPPAIGDRITWLSAATPDYSPDLGRLVTSFGYLGKGHKLLTTTIDKSLGPWRACAKFAAIRELLDAVRTPHVFWVDADCEFLTHIDPSELIDPGKPLSCVRHFAFDAPADGLPGRMMCRVPTGSTGYWQSCVFGGTVGAVAAMLERVRWIDSDELGYDEHAVNIDLYERLGEVKTLPCRYAAPSDFGQFPHYRNLYEQRAGGVPRILHHNREIYGG